MLNLVRIDGGQISIFGMDHLNSEREVRSRIGFVHEASYLFEELSLLDTEKILVRAYSRWDSDLFHRYSERLQLPLNQRIRSFSKGMKMRSALAIALSHHAELIIMDEPTSGLDPRVRHDLYRIIREELMQSRRSFIISTHITSDLEKVADYVALLQEGRIETFLSIDELREEYALCRGPLEALSPDIEELFLGLSRSEIGFQGLTGDPATVRRELGEQTVMERPTIEDLMIYTTSEGEGGRK